MADDIKKQERAIGRKAAKMVQQHVHQVIRQKLHVRGLGDEDMKPILEATKIKSKMGDYRLLGLNLSSNKAGFIQHYGFVGVREATKVYLTDSRYNKSSTQRKSHNFRLPEKKIFENIYQDSGAIDYLVAELSKTRTEALQIKLNDLILTLNTQLDGSE